MDTQIVATTAMSLMEYIESTCEDDPTIKVGEVMIVVELKGTDEDGKDWTSIRTGGSDSRRWIQDGMLHAALYD